MKMNNDFSILMLVAVVAVVGIVSLVMISSPGRSVVPYSSTVLAGENVAGQGFKAMAVASNNIAKTKNNLITRLDASDLNLGEGKIPDLKEPPEPSNTLLITKDMLSPRPRSADGCYVLTQSVVDGASDRVDALTFDWADGCVALSSDLYMTIPIVLRGSTEFKGRGHSLISPGINYTTRNVGIYTYDSTTVQNLHVENYLYGFWMRDYSSVSISSADNNGYGFWMYDYSSVSASSADNNNVFGFLMHDSSSVFGSSAKNNHYYGFAMYDYSAVFASSADNNGYGFWMQGSSSVFGSSADNNIIGFLMYGSSRVESSSADNNTKSGFWMYNSSRVESSSADNSTYGFAMYDSSHVSSSFAITNTRGFWMYGSSYISNVKSLNNSLGLYVSNDASVSATGRFCDNQNDIKIDCVMNSAGFFDCGSLSGSVRADNLDGSNFSDIKILPCKIYPILEKFSALIKR